MAICVRDRNGCMQVTIKKNEALADDLLQPVKKKLASL